jgi:hypothetical protein
MIPRGSAEQTKSSLQGHIGPLATKFSSNASEAGSTEEVTHQLNRQSAQRYTQKIENTPAAQNAGPLKCNGFICLPAAKSEANRRAIASF